MKKSLYIIAFLCLQIIGAQNSSVAQIVPSKIDSLVVVFSGDFMQHEAQFLAAKVDSGYDYDTQLSYFSPFWKSADFAIINLETTLTYDGKLYSYPNFASPMEIAGALKRAGITHVALANNHSLDRSAYGVRQTATALKAAGLPSTGVYQTDSEAQETMFLQKNGFRVAIINFTYGTNGMKVPSGMVVNTPLDTVAMRRAIDRAKAASATHIVAFVHFGDEYHTTPNEYQKMIALWLRSKGVNLVVGSHPHVPQPIDAQNSIVYSLGNFVSNQRKNLTDGGYSVRIKFLKITDRPIIEYMPHYVDVSCEGVEKYRVLMPHHSTIIADDLQRERMLKSIEATRQIINTKVEYAPKQ